MIEIPQDEGRLTRKSRKEKIFEQEEKPSSKYYVARLDECIMDLDLKEGADKKVSMIQALLDKNFEKKPVFQIEHKGEKFLIFER